MRRSRTTSETPLVVELDVSYQQSKLSGISTYTLALAQELSTDPGIRLILCRGAGELPRQFPDAEVRRLTQLDRFRVPRGRIRVIPHQMRPAPPLGRAVVTVHDVIHFGSWTGTGKRVAFGALVSLLRTGRTMILTDTHAVRARLLTQGFNPDRVAVCQPRLPQRQPVPVTSAEPSCGGGGLAYVGNLRPHKDVTSVVRAHLESATTERLHVVTGDDGAALDQLRSQYPQDRAHLLCVHLRASDAERDAVLRTAKATVTASLDEGFGYSIDESLGQGTPVIASFIPPHVENAVGRDVDLFPPGDVRALATLMTRRLVGDGVARPDADSASQLRARSSAGDVLRRLTGQE